jgi:hypothetical protein
MLFLRSMIREILLFLFDKLKSNISIQKSVTIGHNKLRYLIIEIWA